MKQAICSTFFLAVVAIAIAGCSETSPAPAQTGSPNASTETHDHGDHDHGDHDHGDHDHGDQDHGDQDHGTTGSDMEKISAELAKLSPEDAESAEKQRVCPVSGEMLGSMGAPIKVDVKGETAWICCEGCKQKFLDNPDEYLARLHKQ